MTGRLTQEDPIGLAGGLNFYGSAGGDPVSFGDPFGPKVVFQGTELEQQRLRHDWNLMKNALAGAAKKGDREAANLLWAIEWLERPDTPTINVSMGTPTTGTYGDSKDNGDIVIGYERGYSAPAGEFYAPVIIGHEVGHSWSKVNESAWITRNQSSVNGVVWGNIMRRLFGSSCRQPAGHNATRVWPDQEGRCQP